MTKVEPEKMTCPECRGTGVIAAWDWIEAIAHLLLMLSEKATRYVGKGRPLHPWLLELPNHPDREPEPDKILEFTTGLAGRAPLGPFGHDAIDRGNATKRIMEAAGIKDVKAWGYCSVCKGEGEI